MSQNLNFILAGVGGQGTLLAADIIGLVGLELGLEVKKSEVHGMAQRGGSVTSHVRWGERLHAPLIAPGEVDVLIAFERLEGLRYVELLRPQGVVLVNDYRIAPVGVSSGDDVYPSAEAEEAVYSAAGLRRILVPAMRLAEELGQARVNNVVMLGALAALLATPEGDTCRAPVEVWSRVIAQRVPERFRALNERAFAAGYAFVCESHIAPQGR
jgi:indolepyruvate ferredoxin oxidoreductase beta subunit